MIPAKKQNNTDFIVKFKDNEMHQSFCDEQGSQDKNDITTMNIMQSLPSLGAEVIKFESEIEAMAWSKSRTDVAYIEKGKSEEVNEHYSLSLSYVVLCDTNKISDFIDEKQMERYAQHAKIDALEIEDYVADSGIKMCIIDSGYDIDHDDLQSTNISGSGTCSDKPCNWFLDPYRHG